MSRGNLPERLVKIHTWMLGVLVELKYPWMLVEVCWLKHVG